MTVNKFKKERKMSKTFTSKLPPVQPEYHSQPTSSADKNQQNNDKISHQLNRIQGQVAGIVKMYDGQKDCVEIVRQVVAVRGALGRVARELLSGEASKCSRERRIEDLDEILKEVFRY